MICSMTAFATFTYKQDWGTLTWEIRSVNHRYLDISLRLPDELRTLEMTIRERISAKLKRGKIDCSLRFKSTSTISNNISVNDTFADAIIAACQTINNKLHQTTEINPMDILQWPGVIIEGERDTQIISQSALDTFDKLMDDFIHCREREGERLLDLIRQRCQIMSEVIQTEISHRPIVEKLYREKLLLRLSELQTAVDMNRFEQELAYILQKMDTTEELDRLNSHITELNDIFKRKEAVGRRLDFIMQELNREANTLGSKSVHIQTTQASVELKVLIEQIREQVQNTE